MPEQTPPRHAFPGSLTPTLRPPESNRDRGSRRRVTPRSIALYSVVVVLVAAVVISLATLTWTGPHASSVATALLNVRIIGGWAPIVVDALAVAAVGFLVARRPTRSRVVAAVIAGAAGLVVAVIVLWVVAATNAFGVQMSMTTSVWVVVVLTCVGLAIPGFWRTSALRRVGTAAAILVLVLAGTLGINADFGLDPTIADLAGVSTQKTLVIPKATATPDPIPSILDGGALWANWDEPADLPASGTTGQVIIPNTVSGFKARPAGVYFPPAALVKNPPALPLVIMMMGQPGNPDPSFQATILNGFAARHHGLAPIVLVADQIGNPSVDPLCLDTARYGKAETYLTQDVVGWARTHLHVLQDPAHWTIAGYSNGGECALSLGAKYPNIWGNVLDISGEKYPGADRSAQTLASVFGGNTAAYQATWPLSILAKGTYPDTVGIFTVGSNDYVYRQEAIAVNAAASAAGWKTTYYEVLNGGHVLGALMGGLTEGYTVLYPRLGLSDPSTAP
jgi:poly(3-hydroxybutyrate) depolymerase